MFCSVLVFPLKQKQYKKYTDKGGSEGKGKWEYGPAAKSVKSHNCL